MPLRCFSNPSAAATGVEGAQPIVQGARAYLSESAAQNDQPRAPADLSRASLLSPTKKSFAQLSLAEVVFVLQRSNLGKSFEQQFGHYFEF